MGTLRIAGTLALMTMTGCASVPIRNDWSTFTGPGAEYFQKEEFTLPFVRDPLEPFNRVMWGLNRMVLFGVVEPLGNIWRGVVPQPIRDHLVLAADNLGYPARLVNNLLQSNLEGAGDESLRFAVNSTVGVLGLFDPATEWGIESSNENLGGTLVKWGWQDSTYLTLPIYGPSTTRDTLGVFSDVALDPTSYFFPAHPIKRFIQTNKNLDDYKRLLRTQLDFYQPARFGWTIGQRQLRAGPSRELAAKPDATRTVGDLFFAPKDPNFANTSDTSEVRLPSTGRRISYELWLQPKPAPIVFFLPGLGAHRQADGTTAIAEMVYGRGLSVVTISSSMSFDFMATAATVPVPGFAPADAHDVHVALDTIHRDLERKYPNRITARVLMGTTLGAFHTLLIAAAESDPDQNLVDFDRYLAVDPPVQLQNCVSQLDTYYNIPLTFPEDERIERVDNAIYKVLRARFMEGLSPQTDVPMSEEEIQFLVGLRFRIFLHDVIWFSQQRYNMGVLKTRLDPFRRAAASEEIFDFSFMEYFYAFVAPYYIETDDQISSPEQLFEMMDLRSVAQSLPTNGKVRLFTGLNHFTLTPTSLGLITLLLGDRDVSCRTTGSLLGTLRMEEPREQFLDSLQDLINATENQPASAGH